MKAKREAKGQIILFEFILKVQLPICLLFRGAVYYHRLIKLSWPGKPFLPCVYCWLSVKNERENAKEEKGKKNMKKRKWQRNGIQDRVELDFLCKRKRAFCHVKKKTLCFLVRSFHFYMTYHDTVKLTAVPSIWKCNSLYFYLSAIITLPLLTCLNLTIFITNVYACILCIMYVFLNTYIFNTFVPWTCTFFILHWYYQQVGLFPFLFLLWTLCSSSKIHDRFR